MNLFLDSSVILAACGSKSGASRAVFDLARLNGWELVVGRYGVAEVQENLPQLGEGIAHKWALLRDEIRIVRDIVTFPWLVVFEPAKDRPVLFTAVASAEVLLTLDRGVSPQ